MRIVSIVGARPQFVKLAPLSTAITRANFDHFIINTGQHYDPGMASTFFDDLHIPPADVDLAIGSGTHGVQTGSMLARLDPVLGGIDPDWVLVYGDTNSTLAGAISSVKLHLPVAHLEAGLRSRNRLMPEEHNRVLTDHAADLCLAPTELAMRNLSREGLTERARLVGDVMTDICFAVRDRVRNYAGPIDGLPVHGEFILATVHRAENTDDRDRLAHILDSLARLEKNVVLAAHPRLRARVEEFGLSINYDSLRAIPPLQYPAMVSAVLRARSVVTDSGGLQKEAFLLETTCTTLRTETEWPETLANGWNVLSPECANLDELVDRPTPEPSSLAPYGVGAAAAQVVHELSG